jgi:hypothetical protein
MRRKAGIEQFASGGMTRASKSTQISKCPIREADPIAQALVETSRLGRNSPYNGFRLPVRSRSSLGQTTKAKTLNGLWAGRMTRIVKRANRAASKCTTELKARMVCFLIGV